MFPLMKSGKVRRVGISNHNLEQIKRVESVFAEGGVQTSVVQNHCSLLYRYSKDACILEYCKENDIMFLAYIVLEQGALNGDAMPHLHSLKIVGAEKHIIPFCLRLKK